jgi:heptosyltransferase III
VEILVLHPGGLGDIILSLPTIALLRRRYAKAGITIAANLDHLEPVAEEYADSTISLSSVPLHQLYVPASSFKPDMHFWEEFDLLVSWTGFGNSDFTANLKRINPDAIIASWHPGPGEQRHVSRLFIDSLGSAIGDAGIAPETEATMHLNSNARRDGFQWLSARGWKDEGTLIALHPGAGSKSKRWHLERFIELARRLTLNRKDKLLLIEGPAEEGLSNQISEALPGIESIAAQAIPLNLLAAVLDRCRLFIGNDSGLAHLSAAMKVPSVVLFGPTLPRHWAPLGKHVTVLRKANGCQACASDGGSHTCLLNISVDDVIRAMSKRIKTSLSARISLIL